MTKHYEQRKKANEKYLATLEEIRIRLPEAEKEEIRMHAFNMGESMNAFIRRASREAMERDKNGK